VSELLDRIEKEIRERLAATRAAMVEHERLQAALHALTDAGEDAARAVKSRATGRGSAKPAPGPTAPSFSPARAGASEETTTPAKPRAKRSRAAARAPSARKRAARGANREAVLRVVGERPGVTASEISTASGVQRATLSTLLRTLVSRGELEKRSLPSGRTGYALARNAPAQETDTTRSTEKPSAQGPTPTATSGAETSAAKVTSQVESDESAAASRGLSSKPAKREARAVRSSTTKENAGKAATNEARRADESQRSPRNDQPNLM